MKIGKEHSWLPLIPWIRRLILKNWYYGYAMIESLISRKKEFFADDLRAIGNFSIAYNDGYLHVKAEARGIAGI